MWDIVYGGDSTIMDRVVPFSTGEQIVMHGFLTSQFRSSCVAVVIGIFLSSPWPTVSLTHACVAPVHINSTVSQT